MFAEGPRRLDNTGSDLAYHQNTLPRGILRLTDDDVLSFSDRYFLRFPMTGLCEASACYFGNIVLVSNFMVDVTKFMHYASVRRSVCPDSPSFRSNFVRNFKQQTHDYR